ncbi:MAG: hypothetical protein CSB48_14520 [Proteobacteria bacterium]|nr:MAG: hypothetical protein CSB48_14520 [Pseudomonadota bacterium]
MIRFTFRLAVLALIMALVGTLLLSVWMLAVPSGARFAGKVINHLVPSIQIEVDSGNLIAGVDAHYFRWLETDVPKAEAIKVELTGVELGWHWSCLLVGEVCIERFRADTLTISVPQSSSTDSSSTDSSSDLSEVSLPVSLFLSNAVIGRIEIIAGSQTTELTGVGLDADWLGSEIDIRKLDFGYQKLQIRSHGVFGMGAPWATDINGEVQGIASMIDDDQIKALWDFESPRQFRLYGENLLLELDTALSGKLAANMHAKLDIPGDRTPFSLVLNSLSGVLWGSPESREELESWSLLLRGTLADDKMALSASFKDKKYGPAQTHAEFQLSESEIAFSAADIQTGFGSAWAEGSVTLGEELFIRLNGSVKDIRLQDSPLQVPLRLDGAISLDGSWQSEKYFLQAGVSGLDTTFEGVGGSLNGKVALSGKDTSQHVSANLELDSNQLPVQTLDLIAQVSLPKISIEKLRIVSEKGAMSVSGQAKLDETLSWTLNYQLTDISSDTWALLPEAYRHPALDQLAIGAIIGDTTGQYSPDRGRQKAALSINSLAGWLGSELLLGSGTVHWQSPDSQSPDSQSRDFQLQLTGQIRAGESGLTVAGHLSETDSHLEVTADHLLPGRFLPGYQGEIDGKFVVSGDRARPGIDGVFTASDLVVDDWSVQEAVGTIKLAELGAGHSSVTIRTKALAHADMKLKSASLSIEGTRETSDWRMKVVESGGAEGTADCRVGESAGLWQVDCSSLEISHFDQRWALVEPFSFSLDLQAPGVDLADACVSGGASGKRYPGTACIDTVNWRMDTFGLEASFHEIDLSLVESLAGFNLPVKGKLSGKGHLVDTQSSGMQGAIYVMAGSLESDFADSTGDTLCKDIDMVVRLKGDSAEVDASLETASDGQLALSLQVDRIQSDRLVTGKAELTQLDLGALARLFPEWVESRGGLAAEVAISGTLQNPEIDGHWRISHGYLSGGDIPVPVEEINIDGDFSGTAMQYTGVALVAGDEVQLQGELNWSNHWYLESTFAAAGLNLVLQKGVAVTLRPALRLRVENGLANLQGSIHIPGATMELQALPKNARNLSPDVVYVEIPNDSQESNGTVATRPDIETAGQDTRWEYDVDIDVSLGDKVLFRGFGVDTLLNGAVRVVQTREGLLSAMGGVNLAYGKLNYWGQTLKIDHGTMLFQGAIDNPQLTVRASRKIAGESVTVGLNVTGEAMHPEVEVFSEPGMDETDAAFYLITGRKPEPGESLGSGFVTNALLSGGGLAGGWIAGGLLEKIGVSDFQVNTQSEVGGTSVLLSGYVHPDLQVRYGVKLFDEVNSLALRYRLGSNLFLEAMSGLDSSLDVIYSFEVK